MIPQTYRHNKLGTSKLSNFTVNSISIKSNCHLRDSSEKNSKDFHNNLMNKSNNNNSKSNINKLRTTYKPTSHSNKKIYIKIQQKTEYNIILDRTLHTFDKNNKSLRKKNKTNNNSKNIKIMKKLRNTTSENRNKIKNKNISDFINVSFGDSSIEINKPKKVKITYLMILMVENQIFLIHIEIYYMINYIIKKKIKLMKSKTNKKLKIKN